MKRNSTNLYIILLLIVALIFSFLTIYSFGAEKSTDISAGARSAVLYQPETKVFLYEKNADQRLPMASTTKIMTALVALQNSNPSDLVVINEDSVGIEGSSAYLQAGEILSMEELLYALLLQSANDAATAIAYYVGRDVVSFANMMNQKALELGLQDTHFTNPHGLDDKDHYTTARDLAIIAAAALENDLFKQITSTFKKTFATEEKSRTYVNHNKLLRMYDGCIGVKTGYTKKSGRCLVSASEREGLTFISVTLDAPNDWSNHKAMLDFGYNKLQKIHLAKTEEYCYNIPVINGEKDSVKIKNTIDASIIIENKEYEVNQHTKIIRYAVAPIMEGDILGEIIFTIDGKTLARINLVADETILAKKEKGLLKRLLLILK